MDTIRVIVEYSVSENKLKSVLVDGQPLRDIWPIEEKSVEEWFEVSSGRDGWEGLISEIKKVIADQNVGLNFEFQGPNEYKERFDRCIKERGYNTDGISKDQLIKENLEKAEKAEHRGWHKQAIEYYTNAAELSNNPEIQFKVGQYYLDIYNEDIGETYINKQLAGERAFRFFELAAEQGHKDAQEILAFFFLFGISVEKDYKEAFNWLLKSNDQDYVDACYKMGEALISDDLNEKENGFKWFMKAAEQNHPESQCEVGKCYRHGYGVEKDFSEALKWYKKSAEQDYEEAVKEIAEFHEYEKYEELLSWLVNLAEKGNDKAQYYVAKIYFYGIHKERKSIVPPDEIKAFEWYMKAADKNNENAIKAVAECYLLGEGTEKDEEKAFNWYLKYTEVRCTEQDYDEACYKLADDAYNDAEFERKYGEEEKAKELYVISLKWFKKAIEHGDKDRWWYEEVHENIIEITKKLKG